MLTQISLTRTISLNNTKNHRVTMADSSPSANGSPVTDIINTNILFNMNSRSATLQTIDAPQFFFGPFLTQNGQTP